MKSISFSRKIGQIMDYFGLNATSFSKEIGNSDNSAITHLLKKDSKPSLDTINKIITRFPEINLDWFLKDEGEMIAGKSINTGKWTGIAAKKIRMDSNLPVHEFASRIGYDSTNTIYFNESKDIISPSYQKKLMAFLRSRSTNEDTNYRDLYLETKGKLDEVRAQKTYLESELDDLKRQYASMYNMLSKLKDEAGMEDLEKPQIKSTHQS